MAVGRKVRQGFGRAAVLAAAVACTLLAAVPTARAATPGTVTVTFDDLEGTAKGVPLSDQYADRGVTFDGALAVDASSLPGFARSGPAVAVPCFQIRGCRFMSMHFAGPQAAVRIWVGVAGPLPDPVTVTLVALDENDVPVTEKTVEVGPATGPTPVGIQLEVTSRAGSIRGATLGWDGGAPVIDPRVAGPVRSILAVDDLSFDAAVAALSATPKAVDFGTLRTGDGRARRSVTVTNTGNVDVTTGAPAVSGDGAFTTSGCEDVTLHPGRSCRLRIRFLPGAAGRTSATVSFPGAGSGAVVSIRARARVVVLRSSPTSPATTTPGPSTSTTGAQTPTKEPDLPKDQDRQGLASTLLRTSPYVLLLLLVALPAYLLGTRATRRARRPAPAPGTHLVTQDVRTTQRIRSAPPPVVVLTHDTDDARHEWRP